MTSFFTLVHHQLKARIRTLLILPGLALTLGVAGSSLAWSAPQGAAAPRAEVQALVGKTIAEIELRGLKRIEREAVLGKFVSKPGQVLSLENVRTDLRAAFAMGYFDDIEVQAEPVDSNRVNLIYAVKERPVIARIDFEGNERITTNDLRDVIKQKEWSILDVNKVKDDVAALQKHYEEKGFYLAKVNFTVKPLKADQVQLTYRINDYDKVQIKRITFLNNRRYSDSQLKSVFQETKEGGFFSFLSSSGNFKESAFKIDLQRLTYWYLDHGYVKFRYENPVVTVSDDKKWLYITIYVDEGEQYSLGAVEFGGDLLFPKEDLGAELTLKPGETFSLSRRNADIQKLTEKYQDLGYAFVNVIPKFNFRDEQKQVDIEYAFEKGNLVYFGEINIVGNTKTHDKVIRREMRINEGELYSGTKLRESRENVERLGYFAPGEVIFNTISPKGRPDVLDIEISVKERSTGTITLGAGYGTTQGFFFTTTISEINTFGRGQTLSLSAMYSANEAVSKNRSFNLGFTDPYAFDTRWSLGFDLYSVIYQLPNFLTRRVGGDIRMGYPLGDYINAYITYKNETLFTSDPARGLEPGTPDHALLVEPDEGLLSSIIWSVVRDKRNNRFETTGGNYQSASLETAGLGGQKKFIKWNLNNRYYTRLVGDLVFRNSTEVGRVHQVGNTPIPPSERYYLGGPNNMKGYEVFSLGPSRTLSNGNTVAYGGTFQMYTLFELEYPLVREAGLKLVTFFDAGNTFSGVPGGKDENGNEVPWTIRTDAGVGIRWFSPIGPLRFEWGFPLNARPGEESPVFNFFIGPPF